MSGGCVGREGGGNGKEHVETLDEGFWAAVQGDEAGGVVHDAEAGLPGVGLGVVVPAFGVSHLDGVKGGGPFAVFEFWLHEEGFLVEEVAVVGGAGLQHFGVFVVAELVGDVGDRPVVIAVLKGLGDGFTFAVGGDVAEFAVEAEALEVLVHGALHHDLVSGLGIDAGDVLSDGFGDDAGGMIAGHGAGFGALQGPDSHAGGALLGHADEGVGEVGDTVGLHEGVCGMRGAEGVPEGEGGVVVVAGGEAVRLAVHAAILTVGVVEEGGAERHMVERGVEDTLLLGVGDVGLDAGELVAPLLLCGGAGAVEVPVGLLGLQVASGSFGADSRDAGADVDDLVGGGGEVEDGFEVISGEFGCAGEGFVVGVEDDFGGRLRELEGEEAVAIVAPGASDVAPGEGVRRGAGELGGVYRGAAVGEVAVGEVEDDPCFAGLGEGVAVDAGALCGCELGVDLRVLEDDGVEAGLRDLVGVGEAGAITFLRVGAGAGLELHRADSGHDEEVEEVAASGA